MTTDLIAMARECGAHQCSNFGHEDWFDFSREALAAFRRAIIADEAKVVEPFWHAVISDECPVVNKAIRSLEVAEKYAGKCAEHYTGVEVVGLCLASTVAALQARVEELEAISENLKLQAQTHAQEARTANATIAEIYQCVTGATGEPGNWNGAEPVRRRIEELEAQQLPQAAKDLLAERERQQTVEGWTPGHDDGHDDASLAKAAACYALGSEGVSATREFVGIWPWDGSMKLSKDKRRNLVKAGALILAEIERLDRAARSKP